MKESDLQRVALQWLAAFGVTAWRMPIGPVVHSLMQRGKLRQFWKKSPLKGFPDIAGVFAKRERGRMFAVELKSDTGRILPEQVEWMRRLSDAGAVVAVVRSIDELEALMRDHGEVG